MLRSWRWLVVAAMVAALSVTPVILAHLPVRHSTIGAGALLARVQESADVPYSGYAESDGGLGIPVTSQFSSIADLFGGTTQMRVWSRDSTHWRVDAVSLTGERDEHELGTSTWTWDYESNQANADPRTCAAERSPAGGRRPTPVDAGASAPERGEPG